MKGGARVPAIFRWTMKIPAGRRSSEIATNMDLLPTFARLAGAQLPKDRVLDGRDLWPLLSGSSQKSPHQYFYYYGGSLTGETANLAAIRHGRWKLHLKKEDGLFKGTELYDLHRDVGEKINRLTAHPDIVIELEVQATTFNAH